MAESIQNKEKICLVDSECSLPNVEVLTVNNSKILGSTHSKYFSCTLHQASTANNSNKFYLMQILVDKADTKTVTSTTGPSANNTSGNYYLYIRYGRTGEKGTVLCDKYSSNYAAENAFEKQYKAKTGNNWNSDTFVRKSGKYYKLDIEEVEIETEIEIESSNQLNPSELNSKIAELLSLIGNTKLHSETIERFGIDTKKMPLGKISNNILDQGHELLNNINTIINAVENGAWEESKKLLDMDDTYLEVMLGEISDEFWSIIPNSCGRKAPPIIKTKEDVEKYVDLLDVMKNSQIAVKITKNSNNLDSIYENMKIEINSDISIEERKLIEKFVLNTQAPTHRYKIKVLDIYGLNKPVSIEDNQYFNNLSDHRILVHGSRMSNFMGILSEGLRLPSIHQVANGSILGRGIYFADVVTKSFNYCCVHETNNIGFVVLCEVALGDKIHECETTWYGNHQPGKYTSRWGLGETTINLSDYTDIYSHNNINVMIPQGPLSNRKHLGSSASFLYNEYVVFDTKQYRFKYLVKIEKI